MEKFVRTTPILSSSLKVREEERNGKKSRIIEGHAVVFGVRSVNLTPWSDKDIYEVIERGAITQDLINKSDVVLTCFHNNEKILGRSTYGKGTLTLSLDAKGLAFKCELPKTPTADEMLEAISRGDIKGMSFAFQDDEENGVIYERIPEEAHDGKNVFVRHVKRITALYDVTIAGHPAYQQTDVSQREISKSFDKFFSREHTREQRERAFLQQRRKRQEHSYDMLLIYDVI